MKADNSHPTTALTGSTPPNQKSVPKVGLISLGCAKNLIDSELMLGSILAAGMELTAVEEEADALIVNTCSFINSAKEESIETILELHQKRLLSAQRSGQKLIVAGCMSQRFAKELAVALPEVDVFMGLDQVAEAGRVVDRALSAPSFLERAAIQASDLVNETWEPWVEQRPRYIPNYDTPRFRLTPQHFAYTKIAEGCNHPCSFCIIPQMRGTHRSRSLDSIVNEVRNLVGEGVREINLISQDTTYYGMDLWEKRASSTQPVDSSRGTTLSVLLQELQQIDGDFWIRLLYTHPAHWSDELIQIISQCDKVARYVDMPLQHIHPEILKTMQRQTTSHYISDLIQRIRAGIPGVTMRTTFIVGFPGETEAHFEHLLHFVEKTRFERLGIFTYSQEEGSRAAKMSGQVPEREKNRRYRAAMKLQRKIAIETAKKQAGRELKVLVELPLLARSEGDAPEVDCRVVLLKEADPGKFARVRVVDSQLYDLVAEPLACAC